MTRIINYLKNGRGIGTLFLALLAVIITVQFFYASKKVVLAMVPEVQNTLNQLLPIEIENGVVIEPADTVKNVKLKVPFVPGYAGLPVILDTRVDSLDFDELLKSKSSIQISRKNVYVVSKGEVKVRSLGDASYRFEKQDYQEKMKAYVSDTAFVLQDHLQNFRHIGTRYSRSAVLLQREDFYPYIY